MIYGKFVFECNCGSRTEFEPVNGIMFEQGLEKAGIGWEHDTGYNEYMCPACISAVDDAIDASDKVKKKSIECVLANRKKVE